MTAMTLEQIMIATTTTVKSAVVGNHSIELRTDRYNDVHCYLLHNGEWDGTWYWPNRAEEEYNGLVALAEKGWLD
jgi:hypothetical protein